MTTTSPKEVKLNSPKPFDGKRTELTQFIQDVVVYMTINKEIYDTDDKRIAFTISFMQNGDAAAWKREFLGRLMREADSRGDDVSFGTWANFRKSLEDTFSPYDAPGDALNEIRNMKMIPEGSIDEHISRFRILVSQTGLSESAAIADFFRDTLPMSLQRTILNTEYPPTTTQEWYDKASRCHNNWKRMQRILGRGRTEKTPPPTQSYRRPFSFPRKEKDPNAMDVDRLSIEERNALMKEGKCFKCRQFGHLARDCKKGNTPQEEPKKKWGGKAAAAHIRTMVAMMDQEEKDKFAEELDNAGLGF